VKTLNSRNGLIFGSYAVAAGALFSLLFMASFDLGSIILPILLAPPALILALLTWQVSTGERVNLFELIVTALTTMGQTLVGLAFLLVGLFDAGNDWTMVLYGLFGTLVGIALGIFTGIGLRARNRVLRGVTTM
jgi:hypothetical protein